MTLLAINWDIDPVILKFGFVQIRWYSIMFLIAFSIGYRIMRKIFAKEGRNEQQLEPLLYYLIAGTIIGARLGHCLFYDPSFYLSNPLKILAVWEGGLASHGGALGIILSIVIYCKRHNESFIWLTSRLTIPIALSAFFIRIGNLFNSEIVGHKTSVPWGMTFLRRTDLDLVPRHPTQVYEALAYLIVFVILLVIYRSVKAKRADFLILGYFLVTLFTSRFLIEFFKIRQESYNSGLLLNTGQLLSIPFILIGMVLLFISFKNTKHERVETLCK